MREAIKSRQGVNRGGLTNPKGDEETTGAACEDRTRLNGLEGQCPATRPRPRNWRRAFHPVGLSELSSECGWPCLSRPVGRLRFRYYCQDRAFTITAVDLRVGVVPPIFFPRFQAALVVSAANKSTCVIALVFPRCQMGLARHAYPRTLSNSPSLSRAGGKPSVSHSGGRRTHKEARSSLLSLLAAHSAFRPGAPDRGGLLPPPAACLPGLSALCMRLDSMMAPATFPGWSRLNPSETLTLKVACAYFSSLQT